MRDTLRKHLCCPDCRSDLVLEPTERDGDEIMTGDLSCAACGKRWPIVRGVPRFVGEELSGDVRHTARNFGSSWRFWSGIDDDRYRAQLPEMDAVPFTRRRRRQDAAGRRPAPAAAAQRVRPGVRRVTWIHRNSWAAVGVRAAA